MPVISREKIPFISKDGSKEFTRELKVSSVGTFSVLLPADVTEALNIKELWAQSRTDLLQKWNDTIAAFNALKAETRKIIAYEVRLWGDIERDGRNPIRFGDTNENAWGSSKPGAGLYLQVGVFNETEIKGANGKSTFRYAEAVSTIQSSVALSIDALNRRQGLRYQTQMPWSAEREAFFVRMAAGLEALILDLHGAFGDKKTALALVDGKRQLTLTK